MKRTICRLITAGAAALALTGCASIPGGEAAVAAAAATASVVSDVFTGPDTDYTNYLKHCRAEVTAQRDAIAADSKALETGLASGNEKIQFASLVLLAAKAGQGGPRIGCSVSRKKSVPELLLTDNSLLELGKDLYFENRAEKRFSRQLEADRDLAKARMDHERRMARENNDLLTTLTGDKLEQFKAQADADAAARRDAAAAAN